MKKISVVIPVYNNEGSLRTVYAETVKTISDYSNQFTYEIIFTNDASQDSSFPILLDIKSKDPSVIVIDFSRNFGQMAGILAGWDIASGDAIINMSADLQDPISQITEMLKQWELGNEIVINYRLTRSDSFANALSSKFAYLLLKQSLPSLPAGGFDYTLIDQKVLEAIKQIKEKNRFFQGDILWVGFTIKYLPYHRQERVHGKSGYNFKKRCGNFLVAYLNISYTPIRFMSLLGIITALLGFLYSLSILHSYFVHHTPFKGWAPIMMVLLIIGGILMMMLGVIGEYIWRIYDEVKYRPNYIIKKKYVD